MKMAGKSDTYVSNTSSTFVVELSEAIVPYIPPYPGSANILPGSQNVAIDRLDQIKANATQVPSLDDFALVRDSADLLRVDQDTLSGTVDAVIQDAQNILDELATVKSTVANLNAASIESVTINGSQHMIFTLSDGTMIDAGLFPYLPGYRGTASSLPVLAGVVGDWFRNLGGNPFAWVCTVAGAAGAAVWVASSRTVLEDMPFEFTKDDVYDYPVATGRTIITPRVWGAAGSTAWTYSVNGGAFTTVSWPLTMVAQSVLRVTVTGMSAGTKKYAAAERTA